MSMNSKSDFPESSKSSVLYVSELVSEKLGCLSFWFANFWKASMFCISMC